MSTLGVSPTMFSLLKGYGTAGGYDFNSTTAADKVTVLSYIDITHGWDWMHALRQLQDDVAASAFASDIQIIAVIFNYYHYDATVLETYNFVDYSGNISRDWIYEKINSDAGLAGLNFNVLVDEIWTTPSPAAINIADDYSGATDSPKPAVGTFWYASLVDKDFRTSDKWEHAISGVTSFDHISGLAFTDFESNNTTNDYENARAFILQRIENLINPPFIIDSSPADGDTVTTLNPTTIFFSKPMNATEAQNADNYTLNGGGFTGTEHPSSVAYNSVSNAENKATLTISDTLSDTIPAITLTVTGLHDTTPATATPVGPLEIVTSGGANVLNFIADVTAPNPPVVTGTTPTTDTTPTWNWTSGGGGGNGTYRYKLDDSDMSSGTTETSSTTYTPGSVLAEGTHTLYVQERDAAGNWSAAGSCVIEITPDTTPPRILSVVKNPHLDK